MLLLFFLSLDHYHYAGGFLCTSMIRRLYRDPFTMNFMSMVIGLLKIIIIITDFQQCQQIKHMS